MATVLDALNWTLDRIANAPKRCPLCAHPAHPLSDCSAITNDGQCECSTEEAA
jgi:hypothetical protein